MYIKNKYFSIVFKVLIVVIGIYGLYDSCFKNSNVTIGEQFSYYTNLSNLLCIIFFIIYLLKMFFHLKLGDLTKLKSALTVAITVTTIVYNFVLRPFMTDMDGVMNLNSIGNYIVHIIVPIMVILDYILFDKKGLYHKKDPFIWVILPFMYFIFILIRASFGKTFTYTSSRYPYFFIDIDEFGLSQVLFNVCLMIGAIIILGYIYVWIDKLLNKKLLTIN